MKLFIVTAPSGSGKTTVMRKACGREVISYTTRPPRINETHGIDYYFTTQEGFLKLEESLVQRISFHEYYYGITRQEIEQKRSLGSCYAIVSVDGMRQLKLAFPESITIFIHTLLEDCIQNMRQRGDSEETIQKRIKIYHSERAYMHLYDYVVPNIRGNIDYAVNEIQRIIAKEEN